MTSWLIFLVQTQGGALREKSAKIFDPPFLVFWQKSPFPPSQRHIGGKIGCFYTSKVTFLTIFDIYENRCFSSFLSERR